LWLKQLNPIKTMKPMAAVAAFGLALGMMAMTSGQAQVTIPTVTDGGAFSNSASFYGTYDQGGNVGEWNDVVIGCSRGLRGGSWDDDDSTLQPSERLGFVPSFEDSMWSSPTKPVFIYDRAIRGSISGFRW
jgi:hypothetical protein